MRTKRRVDANACHGHGRSTSPPMNSRPTSWGKGWCTTSEVATCMWCHYVGAIHLGRSTPPKSHTGLTWFTPHRTQSASTACKVTVVVVHVLLAAVSRSNARRPSQSKTVEPAEYSDHATEPYPGTADTLNRPKPHYIPTQQWPPIPGCRSPCNQDL